LQIVYVKITKIGRQTNFWNKKRVPIYGSHSLQRTRADV